MVKKSETAEMVSIVHLSLNKVARAMFGEFTRARVRFDEAGEISVRPTDRTKGVASLPDNEVMVDLTRSELVLKIALPMSAEDAPIGTTYVITEENYGWKRFSPSTTGSVAKDSATARVVAR